MPNYTRAWDDAAYPGTTQAKLIDDKARELRVDIHERMDDIVKDWTADPVELDTTNLNISEVSRAVRYVGSNAPGSRVVEDIDIKTTILIILDVITSQFGFFVVDLDEISGWFVADLVGFTSSRPQFLWKGRHEANAPDNIEMGSFDQAANTLTFVCTDFEGTELSQKQIHGTLMLFNTKAV